MTSGSSFRTDDVCCGTNAFYDQSRRVGLTNRSFNSRKTRLKFMYIFI